MTTWAGSCREVLCRATCITITVSPPSVTFCDALNSCSVAWVATPERCQFLCRIKPTKATTTVLCSSGGRVAVAARRNSFATSSQRGWCCISAIIWERGLASSLTFSMWIYATCWPQGLQDTLLLSVALWHVANLPFLVMHTSGTYWHRLLLHQPPFLISFPHHNFAGTADFGMTSGKTRVRPGTLHGHHWQHSCLWWLLLPLWLCPEEGINCRHSLWFVGGYCPGCLPYYFGCGGQQQPLTSRDVFVVVFGVLCKPYLWFGFAT